MEDERRTRLPEQDPESIRRDLNPVPVFQFILSLDQLTAQRDIQVHPLDAVVGGRQRHSHQQSGASLTD